MMRTGLLSDYGGIFVTTRPGTEATGDCGPRHECNVAAVVDSNVVRSLRHFDHASNGLYVDEAAARVNLTRNLVFDLGTLGWRIGGAALNDPPPPQADTDCICIVDSGMP